MLSISMTDAETAMRQAHMTAQVYADAGVDALSRVGGDKWPPEAKATFLAGFMQAAALDLLGVANLSAGQHIAQALDGIKEVIEERAA